jgi:hypothetical protein
MLYDCPPKMSIVGGRSASIWAGQLSYLMNDTDFPIM